MATGNERPRRDQSGERRIVVVAARCGQMPGEFGIRLERSGESVWSATWAFALKEAAAKREGYDRTELRGSFGLAPSYPGCPHCAKGALLCCGNCGKVSCWDGRTKSVVCPWCEMRGKMSGAITALTGRNDA